MFFGSVESLLAAALFLVFKTQTYNKIFKFLDLRLEDLVLFLNSHMIFNGLNPTVNIT